jgi:membrane complex biogenesis BtpA family protein
MKVLGQSRPLVGVVHLLPLPGAPAYRGSIEAIAKRALADARTYLEGGLDGILVENFGDAPFYGARIPAETIAALTAVAARLRELGSFPLGINALRSDGPAALAIATAVGAQFIRVNVLGGAMVTDQGLIQGCAARLMRLRAALRARVAVWGDLWIKHAAPLGDLDPVSAAQDLIERAAADALILTGPRTGTPVDAALLSDLRKALPRSALVIGSGVTATNLPRVWNAADAFIVGTSLKKGGRTMAAVDPRRVADLVAQRRRLVQKKNPR